MSSVSTQPGQRRSSAAAEIAAGASGSSRSTPRAARLRACATRMDVDEPAARDDVLRRRRGRSARSGRAAARSRARCARRSRRARLRTRDGTKRPSTLCSSASPRPVPAAISAMLPPRSASPSCSTCTSDSPQHRDRVRHRLEIVEQRRRAECRTPRRRCARRRATARWSAARPRRSPARRRRSTRRSIARASSPSSVRNAAIIDGRSAIVERAERRARATGRGRAGAASNRPSSVLVPPMSPARIMQSRSCSACSVELD